MPRFWTSAGRFVRVLRHPHGGCGVFSRIPRRDRPCDPAGRPSRSYLPAAARRPSSLIARFRRAEGRVLSAARRAGIHLRRPAAHISMVFQNVYLFEDTILNNIRFGKPDATMEEVREAARKARCHDFIMALPEGYETPVGEGGVSLSGGERQRISLARAMLKDAPVIILDEATASVDPENERQLQEAFEALTRDKTFIMIAHRLSTVRKADQILVLDKGRIIQRGRHEELMEGRPLCGLHPHQGTGCRLVAVSLGNAWKG
ncbi:MAG: ABC transporter ATP-binding protein [Bilophila wadsworthia]